MYTKYLENRSIIVICVMASLLSELVLMEQKPAGAFQNDVAMATTVTSTLIQFNFLMQKLNYIKSQKMSFKSVRPF